MPKWRSEYRRGDNCRGEYRPQREAQSYCSRDCRRAAAYGRERFKAGTVGRRKRRLMPTSHALLGDDIQLECHEDGYPKLPECLDRRPRLPILKAAYAGCLVQPREWRQRKRASATGWPIAQTLYSSTSMSISTANAATAG
jgi:hypothetical protein